MKSSGFEHSWIVPRPTMIDLIFRLLCEPQNELEVNFLPVHHPTEEEQKDPALLARNVRESMCKALNVPGTEHSYLDIMLQLEATKNSKVPAADLSLEVTKITKLFKVDLDTIKEKFKRFSQLKTEKPGRINLQEFVHLFSTQDQKRTEPIPINEIQPEWIHLFQLLDEDGTGDIDFREYLLGLGLVNEIGSESVIKLAFKTYDFDGDGKIKVDDLKKMFRRVSPTQEVELAFAEMDKENTGKIDFETFKTFALQQPESFQNLIPIASLSPPTSTPTN